MGLRVGGGGMVDGVAGLHCTYWPWAVAVLTVAALNVY